MKKISFIILVLSIFLITGCSKSYTELNELGIIQTIGIDKNGDNYLITLNIVNTKQSNDLSTPEIITLEAEAPSISEAMQNIYLESTKKIYLSHVDLLLISEHIAKNDIIMVADFFLRNSDSRNSFITLIIQNETANKIVKQNSEEEINDLIKISNEEYGITSMVTFEEFLKQITEIGREAVLPSIVLDNDKIKISNYAFFDKDKMVGYLNETESIIYNTLTNKIKNRVQTLECDQDNLDIKIKESITTIKTVKNRITLDIKDTISLQKIGCNLNLEKTKDEKKLIQLHKEKLTIEINKFLEKIKNELDLDLIGFTNLIYKNNYFYYKDHKSNLFERLEFNISIDTKIEKNNNVIKEIDLNEE